MDDKKHRQTKTILKILGVIFATGGLICAIIGFADFFRAFGGEGVPKLFFLCFIGFPILFVGIVCLTFGFRKEITRYVKNESVPVINEAGEELQPAVRAVTRAVKEGLTEENGVRCGCGAVNGKGSKFCKECGKPLAAICPTCGEENAAGSKFCNHCGKQL